MLGLAGRSRPYRLIVITLSALLALAGQMLAYSPARAQSFPELSGRVVDAANIIPDDMEARLNQKLEALETQSRRQLVVATLPDLQGYDISDYGYQLGRKWGLGDKQRNDGAILIVAPNERKLRIEVGYGLEGVLTDGLSALIIQQKIVPKFKAGDMPGGIEAGTDAIIHQLTLPDEEARKIAAETKPKPSGQDVPAGLIIWLIFMFLFFILPMILRARGRRYHSSGLGQIILWNALDGLSRGGSSSGWSGGGGGDWGGGGGFSGGGGSFGGGGASGSW